jgi:hypothetical protein
MNRVVAIILGVLVVAVIAAGSFYGGMVYGKNQAQADSAVLGEAGGVPAGRRQFGTPPGTQDGTVAGQFAGRQGGMLFGEIQAIGDGELTVTDSNGEQIQVTVASTTLIQKQAEVTLADLEVGETVVVSGNQDEDGNITARSLQVTSDGGFFGPPGTAIPGGE